VRLALSCVEVDGGELPYKWAKAGFVSWHPMAVLLAELGSGGISEQLYDHAWAMAEKAFAVIESRVADGIGGTLWLPLKKLMRRAQVQHDRLNTTQQIRQNHLLEIQSKASIQPAHNHHYGPSNPSGGSVQIPDVSTNDLLVAPVPDDVYNNTGLIDTAWIDWNTFLGDFIAQPMLPAFDAQQNVFDWSFSGTM